MKTFKQCCSIEKSKKIKILGVDQTVSLLHWYFGDTGTNQDHLIVRTRPTDGVDDLSASAFTASELGAMLPDPFSIGKYFGTLGTNNWGNPEYWGVAIGENTYYGPTQAECMASALIDLIENENLPVSEVNERINA